MRDLAATTLAVFPHFFIVSLDHIFLPRMEMMEKKMLQWLSSCRAWTYSHAPQLKGSENLSAHCWPTEVVSDLLKVSFVLLFGCV